MLVRSVTIGLVAAVLSVGAYASPSTEPARHVLVIQGSTQGASLFDEFQTSFIDSIRADPSRQIEVHTEYLDVIMARGSAYEEAVTSYLRQKYAGLRIEVVVGVSVSGLLFAGRMRDSIFPDARLVFGAMDRRFVDEGVIPPDAVGIASVHDVPGNLAIALRCHPGTRRVAYVFGSSQGERIWVDKTRAEILTVDPNLELIDLSGLAAEDLLARIAALPEDTIVLWCTFFRDANGMNFPVRTILARAHEVCPVPIYGVFEAMLGYGIVGGTLTTHRVTGFETGRLVVDILDGKSLAPGALQGVASNRLAFDAKELERWKIPDSRLPEGAEIVGRPPSAWQQYGWHILAVAAVIFLQALLIAALVFQSRRAEEAQRSLQEQAEFERLAAEISTVLADVTGRDADTTIAAALESARQVLAADGLGLFRFDPVSNGAVSCGSNGFPALADTLAGCEEIVGRVAAGQVALVDEAGDVAGAMPVTHAVLKREGISTVVAVPLHVSGADIGALGAVRTSRARGWSDTAAERLRILADLFANALGRLEASEEIRRSTELNEAVLGSISAQICVMNRAGEVVTGNDAWRQSVPSEGVEIACSITHRPCGVWCDAHEPCRNPESQAIHDGIRSVVDGRESSFAMEYRVSRDEEETWYVVNAERLKRPEGGAVVSNQNVTARKRAEFDAEQRRRELTHYSRVTVMGELAASLAHELNQPLAGVLANAQAAVRFLDADPPNLVEVKEILGDIIDDDRRAGEVIRRLRAMLQSGQADPAEVDLNGVVPEVVKLVASVAGLRRVTIETDLATGLDPVRADRIQMQQVLLNLILNAMDAVDSQPARRISIRTRPGEPSGVRLSVEDTGPGIDARRLGKLFQPFNTTKPDGLGMGLYIAHTIVEAHHGKIRAINVPEGGAMFTVELPAFRAFSDSDGEE